jgi:hypothetical protein
VRNDPIVSQETRKKIEMDHMSRTIRQMQNEISILKRGENIIPPNLNRRSPLHDQRIINDIIEENVPRAPKFPNPNVVVLEEIVEEEKFENFDQAGTYVNQDEVSESIQMDEGSSYSYIFY